MSIKAKFIDSIRWNALSTIGVAVLEILRLFILLRLLSDFEFGLFALASIVLFYVDALNDIGFSGAIIHKKINAPDKLSSIYWFTVFLNFIFAIIIFFLAYPIASFFEELALVDIIKTISIIFIIGGFGTIYKSVLIKEMRFRGLSVVQFLSTVIYFVVSIVLAYKGHGVYALIYGIIAKALMENVGYVILGRREFDMQFIMKLGGLGYYFRFGMYQIGERATNVIRKELDTVLIGKFLGTETLGIYSVMKNLIVRPYTLINPLITNVTLPLMSKINSSKAELKKIYLNQLNALTTVNAFIYIFLAVFAVQFVRFYYPEGWQAHIFSFSIIAITYLLISIANPVGGLVVSTGRADMGFFWNVGVLTIYAICLFIGVQYDLLTLCISVLICQIILFYPNYSYLVKRLTGATFSEYFKMIFKPSGLMFLSIVLPFILTNYLGPDLSTLILVGLLSVLVYMGLIYKYQPNSFHQIKVLLGKN